MPNEFFNKQLTRSEIKSKIVLDYFISWSKIIRNNADKIGYLDFFSGPGKYEDGSESTPMLVLKYAISDPYLRKSLVTFFNDKEKTAVSKLQANISTLQDIQTLSYAPIILNLKVTSEIEKQLKAAERIPSLAFIDPFGYKGLSLEFIGYTIKEWGCDCVFFFNYNRINAAITNNAFIKNINDVFGTAQANELRDKVKGLQPKKREDLVMDTILKSLQTVKGQYAIKYKFFGKGGRKTSHFLILVTKHVKGYSVMKDIMARNCEKEYGVPTYEFSPVQRNPFYQQNLFGDLLDPIPKLSESLHKEFYGKTLSMFEIFCANNIGKPYIAANYKAALLKLEDEGRIFANPERSKRKQFKGFPTMGDNVQITFK